MKMTMLTMHVLMRFENLVDVNKLTKKDIKEAEHCAYCACMCANEKDPDGWKWFSYLIKKHLNIDLKAE